MCDSPSRSLLISEVKSQSINASSEKLTTKASSCGFEARMRSRALLFTEGRLRYIEPELSITRPMETGRSVCWKLMQGLLDPVFEDCEIVPC